MYSEWILVGWRLLNWNVPWFTWNGVKKLADRIFHIKQFKYSTFPVLFHWSRRRTQRKVREENYLLRNQLKRFSLEEMKYLWNWRSILTARKEFAYLLPEKFFLKCSQTKLRPENWLHSKWVSSLWYIVSRPCKFSVTMPCEFLRNDKSFFNFNCRGNH